MRRRLFFSALLFFTFASCAYYRPTMIGDRPAAVRGAQNQPCRVIARTKCAAEQCRGGNMDLVTYQCVGNRQTRCVASFACSAR